MAPFINLCLKFIIVATVIVDLSYAVKIHGEKCLNPEDCDTKICHSQRKVCTCSLVNDYTTNSKVEQQYNNGVCESKVKTTCTLPLIHHDGLAEWKCIANAKCEYTPYGKGSRQIFGVCKCNPGFFDTQNYTLCVQPFEVKTTTSNTLHTAKQTENIGFKFEDQDELFQTFPAEVSLVKSQQPKDLKSQLFYSSTSEKPKTTVSIVEPEKEKTYTFERVEVGSLKTFGDRCLEHEDCQTKFCHNLKHTCDCSKLLDSVLGKFMDRYFSDGKCLSRVNQVCSLTDSSHNDNFGHWNCVKGAICLSVNTKNGSQNVHSLCVCKKEYFEVVNGTECVASNGAISLVNLKERFKAMSYMLSLAINSFVSFINRQ